MMNHHEKPLTTPNVFLSITIVGIIIYFASFSVPFYLDDYHRIVGNAVIKNISNVAAIWKYEPARFLTNFSFAINHALNGLSVTGFHIVNLILHVSNSFFVYLFVKALLQKTENLNKSISSIAFFCALLFLTHPVQTQAVTYITQRATLLATFFYLLCMISYLKFRMTSRVKYQLMALLACILSMSSKENSITLPITLGLLEFIFFNDRFTRRVWILLPYLLLLSLIPFYYQYLDFDVSANITRQTYLITQTRIMFTYIRLLFFPLNLMLEYHYPLFHSWANPEIILPFFCLASLLVAAVISFKKNRVFAFSVFYFFLCLSPESSFVPLNDVIFEHRLYLPSISFFLMISLALHQFLRIGVAKKSVFAIILCVLALLTVKRNFEWQQPVYFFKQNIKSAPGNDRSYINLGHYFMHSGNIEEAQKWFEQTLKINPHNARAHNNLAMLHRDQGDIPKAIRHLEWAIQAEPDLAHAYFNLGMIHHQLGQYDHAVTEFQRAKLKDKHYVYSYLGLAHTYMFLEEYDLALNEMKEILALEPVNSLALYLLGKIYIQQGEFKEAEEVFLRVLKLKIPDVMIFKELSAIYQQLGQADQASYYGNIYAEQTQATAESIS